MNDSFPYMETALTGVIDPYLLSPLGKLDGTSLNIVAVCSGLLCAEAVHAVFLVEKENAAIFVRVANSTEITTAFLEPSESEILNDFINRHGLALIDHWLGVIDSIKLVQRLADFEPDLHQL